MESMARQIWREALTIVYRLTIHPSIQVTFGQPRRLKAVLPKIAPKLAKFPDSGLEP
jgi:hypothetical protein